MIRFLFLIFALANPIFSIFLENCDSPNKSCIFFPRTCNPKLEISYKSNGTHIEFEIFYRQMDEGSYVAIGLSKDDRMGNDLVLFCMRNSYMETDEEKVGIGLNSNNRTSFIYGTVAFVEKKLPFNLEMLGYAQVNRNVYCRVRHRIRPLQKILNGTIGNLLVARGHWINNHGLSYHGKYRMNMGQFDLSRKRKSEACNCQLSSSVGFNTVWITLLATLFSIFHFF